MTRLILLLSFHSALMHRPAVDGKVLRHVCLTCPTYLRIITSFIILQKLYLDTKRGIFYTAAMQVQLKAVARQAYRPLPPTPARNLCCKMPP